MELPKLSNEYSYESYLKSILNEDTMYSLIHHNNLGAGNPNLLKEIKNFIKNISPVPSDLQFALLTDFLVIELSKIAQEVLAGERRRSLNEKYSLDELDTILKLYIGVAKQKNINKNCVLLLLNDSILFILGQNPNYNSINEIIQNYEGQICVNGNLSTIGVCDIFGDGSGVALFQLDGNVNDTCGLYNASVTGNPTYPDAKFNQGIKSHNKKVQTTIPLNYNQDVITISFWCKWSGVNYVMPIGFKSYDLYIDNDKFGFNSANGDVFGVNYTFSQTNFTHIVIEMYENDYTQNKMWINGSLQSLSQVLGNPAGNNIKFKNLDLHIFGWGNNKNYRNFGVIDQLRIFNRSLSNDEVQTLYNEN